MDIVDILIRLGVKLNMNKTDKELTAEIVSAYISACHTDSQHPMPLAKESLEKLVKDVYDMIQKLN